MNLYFDKAGNPIDRHEWSRLMENHAYRVVATTEVPRRPGFDGLAWPQPWVRSSAAAL